MYPENTDSIYLDSFMTAKKGSRTKRRYSPDIAQFRCNMKPLGLLNESSRSVFHRSAEENNNNKKNVPKGPVEKSKVRPVRRSTRLYGKMAVHQVQPPPVIQKPEDPMVRLRNTSDFNMHCCNRCEEIFISCIGLRRKEPSISIEPNLQSLATTLCSSRQPEVVNLEGPSNSSSNNYGEDERIRRSCERKQILLTITNCMKPFRASVQSPPEDVSKLRWALLKSESSPKSISKSEEEITFEEILSDGYMIYPHDLFSPEICIR